MNADMAGSIERIRAVLSRPGMFIDEEKLSYAIGLMSGLNCGLEPKPLEGFRDWLVEKYFEGSSPFAWEALITRLPCCSGKNEAASVESFLEIVRDYLDTREYE